MELWDHQVCLNQAQTDAGEAAGTVLAFREIVRTSAGTGGGCLVTPVVLVVPERGGDALRGGLQNRIRPQRRPENRIQVVAVVVGASS